MLRALFLAFAVAGLPPAVQAQDWATPEVCSVETPAIVEAALAPATLDQLEARAAEIQNGKGRFWRVETPQGAVSHLWGTFHSADPLILDLPQDLRNAIKAARVVAVEIDFVAKSREALRDEPFYQARFKDPGDPFSSPPQGNSIAGLSEEQTYWIRERAIDMGWTEDVEFILSDAGIAEMLLADPCEDFASGVFPLQDDYIQLLGRLAGSDILGLEGRHDFLDELSDPSRAETVKAIIQVYAAYLKPVASNAERATAFALYRQGRIDMFMAWDEAYLDATLKDGGLRALALTDAYLLAERNQRFLDRVSDEIAKGDVVMAVGFAHLPGPTGLVEMLRAAGHSVTRVPVPGEAE